MPTNPRAPAACPRCRGAGDLGLDRPVVEVDAVDERELLHRRLLIGRHGAKPLGRLVGERDLDPLLVQQHGRHGADVVEREALRRFERVALGLGSQCRWQANRDGGGDEQQRGSLHGVHPFQCNPARVRGAEFLFAASSTSRATRIIVSKCDKTSRRCGRGESGRLVKVSALATGYPTSGRAPRSRRAPADSARSGTAQFSVEARRLQSRARVRPGPAPRRASP